MKEPLPTNWDAITPAWLTDRMSERYPGLVVEDIETVEIVHGTTTKARVKLTLNEVGHAADIPQHVCIKSNFEHHAPVSMSHGLYDTEALFYRDIRPLVPLPAPACYYATADRRGPDGTSTQGFIVLEDLKHAGAHFGANTSPLTVDQAAAALEDLATLHAHWWESTALDRFAWLETSHAYGTVTANRVEARGGLAGTTELLLGDPERTALMPATIPHPQRFIDAYNALVKHENESKAPRCFIHGDTHLGNSYWTNEGRLYWLDWQLVRKGRCVRELSYFLGQALDIETRRRSERELIAHYLRDLRAKGVEGPTMDEAWADYQLWPIWGLYCWIVTQDYKQPKAVNHATIQRFATAMDDFDTYGQLLKSR